MSLVSVTATSSALSTAMFQHVMCTQVSAKCPSFYLVYLNSQKQQKIQHLLGESVDQIVVAQLLLEFM